MIILVIAFSLFTFVGCGNQQGENLSPTETHSPTETPSPTDSISPTEAPDTNEDDDKTTEGSTETPTPTPEPHVHKYTENVVNPTCTESGYTTFTCECGDNYTETLKALGHTYETIADSEVKATCETNGKNADTKCSLCGDQITGEVIPATGHQYGDYVFNNDATYINDGTKSATCALCGDKNTVKAEGTKLSYTYTEISCTKFAKSNVNVRSLPSTDGTKLGGLTKGDAVTVTGKCNETGWFRIEFNNSIGYVSANYLLDEKPAEPTPTPEPDDGNRDPRCVEGLPFETFKIYDEGNIVYYWYPSGWYDGYGGFKDEKTAAGNECRSIMSDRYGSFDFQNQYEDYYYECSWGNAYKDGKRYIRYCKYAFYERGTH